MNQEELTNAKPRDVVRDAEIWPVNYNIFLKYLNMGDAYTQFVYQS